MNGLAKQCLQLLAKEIETGEPGQSVTWWNVIQFLIRMSVLVLLTRQYS